MATKRTENQGRAVTLVWPGKGDLQELPKPKTARLHVAERWRLPDAGGPGDLPAPGSLIHGDNLTVMATLLQDHGACFDLIYIDPPFATGDRFYRGKDPGDEQQGRRAAAYSDRWSGGMAGYLDMMAPRLVLMRQLLCARGSLLVHVDQRASSHLRLLLDEIFGTDALVNEIIWCYGGGGATRRYYPRKHDTILWYARSKEWIFNRQYRPYSQGTVKRGLTAVKGDKYKLRTEGAGLDDWWTGPQVQKILSPTAYENLKYPTQKPEGLLRRIITGHSDPGGLVGDFFCGSGTALAVAGELGRRWIGCDAGRLATQTCRKRLAGVQPFDVLTEQGMEDPAGSPDFGLILEGGRLSLTLPQGAAGPDFWAVDWAYDGGVFEPGWSCRATRKVPAAVAVEVPDGVMPEQVAALLVGADGAEGIVRVQRG